MRPLAMFMIVLAAVGFADWVVGQDRADFLVIVHPENPTRSMDYLEVSDMFLTKTKKWGDKTVVRPVDLKAGSPIRDSFSKEIHQKSVASVESFLHQQIFSGRAKPPLVVASDAEVVDFVSKNPGAIGYVSSNYELVGVRVLLLLVSPQRIKFVEPRYTSSARRAKAHGTVVLELLIDADGNVTDAYALTELGFGLTQAAINAAKQWKYQPATLAGEPTETTIRVSVRFN